MQKLLRIATVVAALAMIVMAIAVKAGIGGMPIIVSLVFLFFSMNGVVAATSTAAALDEVPEIAGSASALIGALQYGSEIQSSLLLAAFGHGTPWTMTWIMLIFTCASALVVAIRTRSPLRELAT